MFAVYTLGLQLLSLLGGGWLFNGGAACDLLISTVWFVLVVFPVVKV